MPVKAASREWGTPPSVPVRPCAIAVMDIRRSKGLSSIELPSPRRSVVGGKADVPATWPESPLIAKSGSSQFRPKKSSTAWSLCHVPAGGGRCAPQSVSGNPAADRWAVTGPFATMTAARPVASRSPDRTGVYCAGRSAPSQGEMVTAPGCSSPNQPDKERTTAYRASAGPDSWADANCATIVGDWEEPSGEFRIQ